MDNSIIKDIGRSYIVSSFLPSVLIVSLGFLIYRGFSPEILEMPFFSSDKFNGSQWFLFLALITWLAFFLYSIINWTIRLYEGYYFPLPLRSILVDLFILPRFIRKTTLIQEIRKIARNLNRNLDDIRKFVKDKPQALTDFSTLEFRTPLDKSALMPTRLGNVLIASEIYAEQKYKIKSVPLWPRLAQVLPDKLRNSIEEKNNQLIFLLNSSMLSYLNAMVGLIVGFVRLPCETNFEISACVSSSTPNFFERGYFIFSPVEYFAIGICWVMVGYFVYLVSIPVAEEMGSLIRTGFDLYRFDLLYQMNYPIPSSLEEEQNTWIQICEYMVADNQLVFEATDFTYHVRPELTKGINLKEKKKQYRKTAAKKDKN